MVHGVHGPWCPWSKAQSPEAAGPRPRGLVVHVWCPWIINNEPWSMTHGPWSMVGPWPMMSMVSMCRRCNTLDAITYVIYYEICSWLGTVSSNSGFLLRQITVSSKTVSLNYRFVKNRFVKKPSRQKPFRQTTVSATDRVRQKSASSKNSFVKKPFRQKRNPKSFRNDPIGYKIRPGTQKP